MPAKRGRKRRAVAPREFVAIERHSKRQVNVRRASGRGRRGGRGGGGGRAIDT